MNKQLYLHDIEKIIKIEYVGEDVLIDGMGLCNRDTEYMSIISYVTSDKYLDNVINNKKITCLVVTSDLMKVYSIDKIGREITYIVTEKPEVLFYNIHEALCKMGELYEKYDFDSRIGDNCFIAESAVVERGVIIGNNVVIGANTVIKSGSIIDDCVSIGCNTTIGSEGFQIIIEDNRTPIHVTHVGRCHICANVYVGDNSCVCNSLFGGETYIGEGAKIDNLVHVAHNLYVGKGAVVTAHVILCGSSRIEEYAWIGPNSSILNQVTIGKGAKVGLGSVVTRDVEPNTLVYGCPAKVH